MSVGTLSPDAEIDPAIERCCLRDHCAEEIRRFKWIASQEAGRDLGEEAIRQWIKDHWHGYLRSCWFEHLLGKKFWYDIDQGDFELLPRTFQNEVLLDPIIEKLQAGQENLDITIWALSTGQPMDRVRHILAVIDINSKRKDYWFESNI